MKKMIMVMLLLATVSINCFALSETAVILHHGDSVKVYEGPSQLATALNDAVDNDIIYLGKGAYPGFQITKKVRIIGSGNDQTQINGSISINFESDQETPTTYTEPILEGLFIPSSSIYLYNYAQGVTIRKCNIFSLSLSSGTYTGLKLDRCKVGTFYYSQDMHEVSIINSMINTLSNYGTGSGITIKDDFSIFNSNIHSIYYPYFNGSMINSIIDTTNSSSRNFSNGNFVNTFYYNITLSSSVNQEGCYQGSDYYYDSTTEELLEKGYLGTDGTVVGCYGGATPFTLEMSVPAVDEARSKIEVDNAKKVLNVSLKLTSAPEEPKEDSSIEE